jgi:hypothetical protein
VGVAKRKLAAKKPVKKARAKPAKKTAVKPARVVDAAPELQHLGFFHGEYHWEADRDVPCFDARLRLLVDHTGEKVTADQVRAVELLLETEAPLRPAALKAAYECLLQWVEGYRQRHPAFRGKPIAERPFIRGCELKTVLFPSPNPSEKKPAPTFILSLFWPDDTRPCEVRFEWTKGAWVVTNCERI